MFLYMLVTHFLTYYCTKNHFSRSLYLPRERIEKSLRRLRKKWFLAANYMRAAAIPQE